MPKAALIVLSSHKVPTNHQLLSRIKNLLEIKHHHQQQSREDLEATGLQVLDLSEGKLTVSHTEEDVSSAEDRI